MSASVGCGLHIHKTDIERAGRKQMNDQRELDEHFAGHFLFRAKRWEKPEGVVVPASKLAEYTGRVIKLMKAKKLA